MGEGASGRASDAARATRSIMSNGNTGAARTVERVAQALADAASSPAKVFLLASRAPDARVVDRVLDFLVVEETVEDRFAEAVSLSKVLGHLRVPGEVMVVDRAHFDASSTVGGTVTYEAASEGRIVAES